MTAKAARRTAYVLLPLAYVLHNDLWLWDDPEILLGLPAGLLYHVLYCGAVAVLMAGLLRLEDVSGSGSRS